MESAFLFQGELALEYEYGGKYENQVSVGCATSLSYGYRLYAAFAILSEVN